MDESLGSGSVTCYPEKAFFAQRGIWASGEVSRSLRHSIAAFGSLLSNLHHYRSLNQLLRAPARATTSGTLRYSVKAFARPEKVSHIEDNRQIHDQNQTME